jgi:putative endonuclease
MSTATATEVGTKAPKCNKQVRATAAKGAANKKRKELGARGEKLASQYLERGGFEILSKNWKCKAGEADIVGIEDDSIVFVEVKTRKSQTGGFPEEAITPAKRRRYEQIAILYLSVHDLPSARVRFDVIALNIIDESKAVLRHHRDAFCAGE